VLEPLLANGARDVAAVRLRENGLCVVAVYNHDEVEDEATFWIVEGGGPGLERCRFIGTILAELLRPQFLFPRFFDPAR
jgi:hypothetical protein